MPTSPYLFLIVGEALNVKIYEEQRLGRIEGINLPMSNRRHIIAQYTYDMSFTLKAFQEGMIWLTRLLDLFNIASNFQINHVKFIAFQIRGRKESRLTWTEEFKWTWASSKAISNLLGMLFGLSLCLTYVDNFLLKKVQHKLNYWASTKLSLVRRKMIVNNIFLSSLWYFVGVWGGTKKNSLKLIAF